MLQNSFDNQRTKINQNDIFYVSFFTVFYENFCPTTHLTTLHLDIKALVSDLNRD